MDPVAIWILRAFLSVLLAVAAAHKLRDLRGFRETLREYRLLPERSLVVFAPIFAASEALLAVGLSWPGVAVVAAVFVAALFAVYTAAIGANLARGRRDIDCGCLGPAGRQSLSGWLVARNVLLIAMALAAAWPEAVRDLTWVDGQSIVAGTVTALLIFRTANTLVAEAPASQRLRRLA